MTQAYPLQWPQGWQRTPPADRRRSQFRVTPDKARRNLIRQLELLGATPWAIVISTNVRLRGDGQPYADELKRTSWEDPGVAIFFELNGKPMAMARDIYATPHENMHALGHAIEHMRGLERLCGRETRELAEDAAKLMRAAASMKSITSPRGPIPIASEWSSATPSFFVAAVMSGFIQSETPEVSSYDLSVEVVGGWTLVPNAKGKPMADTPRYKMIGNAWAVAPVRWIGERIALVDAML